MRIERIELIGFKSFSEKTVFGFHPGITAIVGPNGCGKSNIVDAFRWVLGEQSAKSLRGNSMEDVIFNGSITRKPKGMAEATLVISGVNNSPESSRRVESPAGLENGELSITRRLYRSGESDYLINKVPCRLKDIKDIFLDTGLELKTYSILEQNRMDEILNSKPPDRRFLIEEVAGVMKYKVRKAEALQKLESSQQNLQRLQDIIGEVKRQINSIDRYAKKAERYKKLLEEIKEIELRLAKRDIAFLSKGLSELTSTENTLKSREVKLSTDIHSIDASTEQKKLACTDNEKSLEEIQTRFHSAQREITEGEGRIALLKNDCENLRDRIQRLFIQDSELADEMKALGMQIKEAEDKDEKIRLEILNLEKTLEGKNNSVTTLNKEISYLEHSIEAERKRLFEKAESISVIRNEINNLTSLLEDLHKKEKNDIDDISSLRDTLSSLDISIKEKKDSCLRLGTELKNKGEAQGDMLDDVNKKKEKVAEIEGSLYKDREEMAGMSSRYESLRELYKDKKEAVGEDVRILCQIADIFESPPEYETAIESALGERLNASIVDNYKEIKKALKFIKEHKITRSAFMPVDIKAQSSKLKAQNPNLKIDGVIGNAFELVSVKGGFDGIASSLLGDVIIVNDLNTAFDLWHKAPAETLPKIFVTLDGEVFEPSGIVSGGIERGILKIKREVRELEKNIDNKKALISSNEDILTAFKEDITSIENALISLNNEISRIDREKHELQLKIAGLEEEKSRHEKKLGYLSLELDVDRKEINKVKQDLKKKNETLKISEDERHTIEDKTKETRGIITEKKNLLEELRAELTEAKLSLTSFKEKTDSLINEKKRLNMALLEIEKKKDEISHEHSEIEIQLIGKEAEIKEGEELLRLSVVMVKTLQEELSKIKESLESKRAELNLLEKKQKAYMVELEEVRKEFASLEIKKTESSLRLQHIREDIKKSYGVDPELISGPVEQVLPEESLKEDEQRLPLLKEKLQEVGPVNLGTLEEFEELKMRHEFLTKQQEDLLQSINSLQEAISKINRTTRARLTEAFNSLNEKFKEVFAMLFGKGRAELILTSDDILEAGIEIVAQPPGKKLQNLMLLSGGEKALTALSLLFAGFMIKPTPLCILDEVDAPLDESNTDRFTSLLKELARDIQFITITHNRRTMEVADYIYGITMEEPGISKVISMHMAEAV